MLTDKPWIWIVVVALVALPHLVASVPLNTPAESLTVTRDVPSPAQEKAEPAPPQESSDSSRLQQRSGEIHNQESLENPSERDSRHLKNQPNDQNSFSPGLRQFLYPFFPQGTGRGSWTRLDVAASNEGNPARRSTVPNSGNISKMTLSFTFTIIALSQLVIKSFL